MERGWESTEEIGASRVLESAQEFDGLRVTEGFEDLIVALRGHATVDALGLGFNV